MMAYAERLVTNSTIIRPPGFFACCHCLLFFSCSYILESICDKTFSYYWNILVHRCAYKIKIRIFKMMSKMRFSIAINDG